MPKPRTREQDAIYQRERRARKRREREAQAANTTAPDSPDADWRNLPPVDALVRLARALPDMQPIDGADILPSPPGALAASIAEPAADDPDVVDLPVRLDDAHFAKLAALMRAVEARHGARVKAPAAMRIALDLAHRAIADAD